MEGEKVFLKVSPTKDVIRFGRKGKLSPRFSGPFEVFQRVGKVAYKLALPPSLLVVHLVFHISILRKYNKDKLYELDFGTVHLDEKLAYEEEPVAILDRQVWKLMSKEIILVRVLWKRQSNEEATWEDESDMQSRYPYFFSSSVNSNYEAVPRDRIEGFGWGRFCASQLCGGVHER
uniref:Tf2-1-like SH3-like domain-containing protein n=1 Tax=Nicotiana tabacum TaxID=4097 RepID=A0A1S4ARM3_TOBAC